MVPKRDSMHQLPQCLLAALGVGRVPADEVTLKPSLMAHEV